MNARHTARQGILNCLTGRAVCPAPRPADEAEGLLNAHRAENFTEAAALLEDKACDADFTEDPKYIAGLRDGAALLTRVAGEKATAEAETATPDFFQPGHTYTHTPWQFRCDTHSTHPATGERRALGWLLTTGGQWQEHALDPDDWAHGNWTDVTESGGRRG